MRYLLKYDGWAFHQGLPHHWMYKFSANKLVFCSPEGKRLESREKVLQFLKCEGGDNTEKDVEKVQCFNVSRGPGAKQNRSLGMKVRREEEKSSAEDSEAEESTEMSELEYHDESDCQLNDSN